MLSVWIVTALVEEGVWGKGRLKLEYALCGGGTISDVSSWVYGLRVRC